MAAPLTITQGKTKGTPLEQATDQDILYCGRNHAKDLAAEPNGEFAGFKRRWLAGAREVLKARGVDPSELEAPAAPPGGGGGAYRQAKPAAQAPATRAMAPAQSAPLAERPKEQLISAHDIGRINALLQQYEEECHLVTPATSCGSLPEGFEVSFSLVRVSSDTSKEGPGDVSSVGGGKLSLSKTPLKRIGSAAGISWLMEKSGRVDDRSEPLYCAWRAVGQVSLFDGSKRVISGEVDIDVRDGSKDIEAMYGRARGDASNVDSQIRDLRMFLQRHAETKAKLRAIEDIGIKRSYTAKELEKPFVVARLTWSGRTDDPELRRQFALMGAEAHFASVRALYGQEAPAPRRMISAVPVTYQAPHAQQVPQFGGHAPPPVGSVVDHDAIPQPRPTPPQQGAPAREPGDDDHDPGFAADDDFPH